MTYDTLIREIFPNITIKSIGPFSLLLHEGNDLVVYRFHSSLLQHIPLIQCKKKIT